MFEVLDGRVGSGETDVVGVRQQFGGVRALELNAQVAPEASRMQGTSVADGERMAARDLLIAATARSTGDELVVADRDFKSRILSEMMDVTNRRRDDHITRTSDSSRPVSAPA